MARNPPSLGPPRTHAGPEPQGLGTFPILIFADVSVVVVVVVSRLTHAFSAVGSIESGTGMS